MKAAELIKIAKIVFGPRGWQMGLATFLGVDASTIRRWIAADHVPGPAAIALSMLKESTK